MRASRTATRTGYRYAEDIRSFFGLAAGELPHFDITHFGIGADGHTASLFPGEPLLEDRTGIADVYVEKMTQYRVTLLPGVLLSAKAQQGVCDGRGEGGNDTGDIGGCLQSATLSGADYFPSRARGDLVHGRRGRVAAELKRRGALT